MSDIQRYPLTWPIGRARTRQPGRHPRFDNKRSMIVACEKVIHELKLLSARSIIISTNVELRLDGLPYSNRRAPSDSGTAVYFKVKGIDTCLSCDKWDRVEHNLWAVALYVEALRQQLRNGVGTIEQAFAGFKALPHDSSIQTCWDILGVPTGSAKETIVSAWKAKLKTAHPDCGGSHERVVALNIAKDQAISQIGAKR